jgi:glycosyltransferase involved in cell wall biosynthesis
VCHTPSLEDLQVSEQPRTRSANDPFTLAYVGLFAPGIGSIEPILTALPYVLEQDKNVRFLIGGGGEHLLPLVKKLGIQDHVVFCGMIPSEKMLAWLQQADLGIVAYPVNAFTNVTISNKLFHYMAVGLPVLSTDMAPTRRILEEVGCGRTFPLGSTDQEVAQIILQLKNSPEERAAMEQNARAAILNKYNWNFDFEHALRCMETLVAPQADGTSTGQTLTIGSHSSDSQS